ncbi:MAG: hypothetical protein A2754_02975 [Candidatus Magasanikbacteria bacterium RIFCSPHIGHO2_01_FULL_47_8]|uniref:Solute-binding protein family 5 domain-containing protein n=1 Tax=Candidatus Magasanikbacteria bacterium RIFCSPHIGHO2_01_FULL_47_8 TaxID=1798673 RepID=A0A1F6MCW6_9BACT|nr:MAG: hypothetical protein A2754_02975 [Candidatus Magasanikbacteria bacterium RIFCSPHIGHO2_01_FULL_47_8]
MFSQLNKFWQRFSGAEKKLLLLLILVVIVSEIFSLTVGRRYTRLVPASGGQYVEGLVGQPHYINPLLAPANDVDQDLSRIIYAGLLKFDKNLNLVPDLAQDMPEIGSDGKQFTIKLRDNLYWPTKENRKITADDVVFTILAIQNPDYQSPLRLSWNRVSAEKVDDLTVRITTRESSATFISNLTVGILPKHIWETIQPGSFALSQLNLQPVGAGPFQVAEVKRAGDGQIRSLTLSPNRNFHLGPPYLKKITFKFYPTTDDLIDAYHSRDIDGLGYVPFDKNLFIEAKKNLQQIVLPLPQYQAVFINRIKNPAPLEDAKVRLALAKSVDKNKIIAEVYGGQAQDAYGPILPGHLGYHEQIPGADMNIYDAEKAKALLDAAGWVVDAGTGFRHDKQNRTITLSLVTNNFTPNVRVAELLRQMWEAIGIKITLSIEATSDLEEKRIRSRDYELLLFSENVGADPDPFPFWHSSQLRDPGFNLSTFSNKEADKLLVDGRTNISSDQRAAKYKQFQEIFVGDVPAIFLNRSVFVYNVTSDVQGLDLNTIVTPSDRFANINEWYIETKRVKK